MNRGAIIRIECEYRIGEIMQTNERAPVRRPRKETLESHFTLRELGIGKSLADRGRRWVEVTRKDREAFLTDAFDRKVLRHCGMGYGAR